MTVLQKQPQRIAITLFPGFALTSFSLAIEALSVANQLNEQTIYDYQLYSADPNVNSVTSSNNVPIAINHSIDHCDNADRVFLCAYQGAAQYKNKAVLHQLKRLHNQGSQFVSLSSGSFILAKAGLLQGRSCTLFHEHINPFKELYPTINVQENIFTVDGPIFTCAGGITALDILLYIISVDHGRDFSKRVAEVFLQDRVRTLEETQKSNHYIDLRTQSPLLGAAIEIMDNHMETPLKIQAIAQKIGTTTRTLEKVFQKFTQTSPNYYYQQLRLVQAKSLLENTHLPIATVAQATGFTSQSYFSKCFRESFEITPSQLRKSLLL